MSTRPDLQRLRLHYRKDEVLMFIGHLDLMRFMFRCFRRAGFPYAVAGAFSPKPCVTFCPTAPLGVLADAEVVDVELKEGVRLQPQDYAHWLGKLAEASAPRDFIYSFHELDAAVPLISRQAVNARYQLRLADAVPESIRELLSADMPVTDKLGKSRDLALSLRSWELEGDTLRLVGGCSGDQHLNIMLLGGLLESRNCGRVLERRRLGLLDREGNAL